MAYLLLVVSIVLCVLKSASYNYYAKEENPGVHGVFRFNFISYAFAAVLAVILAAASGTFTCAWQTALCAFGYAVIVLSLQSIMIFAMKKGSMATTSLLNLYGMVIPAIAGPIFWKESFGVLQGIGLGIMIVSVFFLSGVSTKGEKMSIWPIVLGIACFLFSGLAGLMEKIHQSTPGRSERSVFLAIAYSIMLVISCIVFLSTRKATAETNSVNADGKRKMRFWIVGSLVGLITGAYGSVNLYLAGNLDSLIYFPVANGGALLLTVLVSVLFFREKPSIKKIIGFVLGLAAVLLLCFPTA